MSTHFQENLDFAYRSLESRLDEGQRIIATNPEVGSCFPGRLWIKYPIFPQPEGARKLLVPLGSGYLLKVYADETILSFRYENVHTPLKSMDTVFLSYDDNSFQETNAQVLANHGSTEENGFRIPDHKVVGVNVIEGKTKVVPNGHGWTIVEDMSEDGKYPLVDIQPYHFFSLENRHEFTESYMEHLSKLLEVYNHPSIDANVTRHGRPNNPYGPLSRMLLLKIKDGIGQIIIGDLDNVELKVR